MAPLLFFVVFVGTVLGGDDPSFFSFHDTALEFSIKILEPENFAVAWIGKYLTVTFDTTNLPSGDFDG